MLFWSPAQKCEVGSAGLPSEPNGYGISEADQSTQHGWPADGAIGVDPEAVWVHCRSCDGAAASAPDGSATEASNKHRHTVASHTEVRWTHIRTYCSQPARSLRTLRRTVTWRSPEVHI